jgi:hypothetical protein
VREYLSCLGWLLAATVEDCDDEDRLVYRLLDSVPLPDHGRKLKIGAHIRKIVAHSKLRISNWVDKLWQTKAMFSNNLPQFGTSIAPKQCARLGVIVWRDVHENLALGRGTF